MNEALQQLMHDACLFSLPRDEWDLKIWRKLSAKFLKESSFREQILPQAAEIETLIKFILSIVSRVNHLFSFACG
ncbi:MAG: hypothetical protein JSS07_04440 [Proteobacteria bacterium]|nr:hypothetical protein [Pseudomonadota bacterium]